MYIFIHSYLIQYLIITQSVMRITIRLNDRWSNMLFIPQSRKQKSKVYFLHFVTCQGSMWTTTGISKREREREITAQNISLMTADCICMTPDSKMFLWWMKERSKDYTIASKDSLRLLSRSNLCRESSITHEVVPFPVTTDSSRQDYKGNLS